MDKLTYQEFRKQSPLLTGSIRMPNGQIKSGLFKRGWNKWSNSPCYDYYTYKGRKGAGGFDLAAAYDGYNNGRLKIVKAGDRLVGVDGEIIVPDIK